MSAGSTHVLATFAAVWATLHAGHGVADHVFGQTDRQAAGKSHDACTTLGLSRRQTMAFNVRHVVAYHVVLGGVLLVAWLALPLELTWTGVAAGLAGSAVTHAFIDRRWPVRWLLVHTGSPGFARLDSGGLNGMYLADQALHGLALWGCAVLVVSV